MNSKYSDLHPKSSRAPLVATTNTARTQATRRRSNRMSLHLSIGLAGEDRLKCSFTMPARATNLNRHGAVVHISRDLAVGSVVLLRNQRGTQRSARIVSQLTATKGISTYGVEFVEQDETANTFWGITFPPNA